MRTKNNKNGASPSVPVSRRVQESLAEPEPSLVATGKHSTGFITFDELGRPRWGWMDELGADPLERDTPDVLRALQSDALSLADEAEGSLSSAQKDHGYDPYDTVRRRVAPRFKRR